MRREAWNCPVVEGGAPLVSGTAVWVGQRHRAVSTLLHSDVLVNTPYYAALFRKVSFFRVEL